MLPIAVQNFLVGLYSEKLKLDRNGREFEEILSFLQSTSTWSSQQILQYKEESIFKIIEHAYNHCSYYRKRRRDIDIIGEI